MGTSTSSVVKFAVALAAGNAMALALGQTPNAAALAKQGGPLRILPSNAPVQGPGTGAPPPPRPTPKTVAANLLSKAFQQSFLASQLSEPAFLTPGKLEDKTKKVSISIGKATSISPESLTVGTNGGRSTLKLNMVAKAGGHYLLKVHALVGGTGLRLRFGSSTTLVTMSGEGPQAYTFYVEAIGGGSAVLNIEPPEIGKTWIFFALELVEAP